MSNIPDPAEGTENASKNIKVMKYTTKMFKEARKASPAMQQMEGAVGGFTALGLVMKALEPVLQIITPIFEIIGALFSAMGGAIATELLPVMQPLFDALLSLMPVFVEMGTIIGQALAPILVLLVDMFVSIVPFIADLIVAFMPLIEDVIKALVPILETLIDAFGPLIEDVMEALVPIIETLVDAFGPLIEDVIEALVPIIEDLIEAFMPLIEDIIEALAPLVIDLVDAFLPLIEDVMEILEPLIGPIVTLLIDLMELGFIPLKGIFKALGFIMEIINPAFILFGKLLTIVGNFIQTLLGTVGSDEVPQFRPGLGSWFGFQKGTDYVPQTGPATLHRGESVQPAGQVMVQVQLLTEIRDMQRQMLLNEQWKHNRSRTSIRG